MTSINSTKIRDPRPWKVLYTSENDSQSWRGWPFTKPSAPTNCQMWIQSASMNNLWSERCCRVAQKTRSRISGSNTRRSKQRRFWSTQSITNSTSASTSRKFRTRISKRDTGKRIAKNLHNCKFSENWSKRRKMADIDREIRKMPILKGWVLRRTSSPKIQTLSQFWATVTTKTKTPLNLQKPLSPKRSNSRSRRRRSWLHSKKRGIKIPNLWLPPWWAPWTETKKKREKILRQNPHYRQSIRAIKPYLLQFQTPQTKIIITRKQASLTLKRSPKLLRIPPNWTYLDWPLAANLLPPPKLWTQLSKRRKKSA